MALKLNVAVSRKIGMPDYGPVVASCSLELEVDASLTEIHPAALQARILHAYEAVRQAVQDELSRLQAQPAHLHEAASSPCPARVVRHDHCDHAENHGNGAICGRSEYLRNGPPPSVSSEQSQDLHDSSEPT